MNLTEEMGFLLTGVLLGLAIAAPVGPIGVLCIRRTLADGVLPGFVSGIGAATADAIYGSVAGFGLTFVSSALLGQQFWIRLIGGAFLCYLGLRGFLATPVESHAGIQGRGLAAAYVSTLVLTLANPMTILSFAAVFAGLGLATSITGYLSAALLVLGVFLGSSLWWLLLSGGVGIFRKSLGRRGLVWVNRASGAIILTFGLVAILSLTGITLL